jgi:hypothetical protein
MRKGGILLFGSLIWIVLTWAAYATHFNTVIILGWGIWTFIGICSVYYFAGTLVGVVADKVAQTEIKEGVKSALLERKEEGNQT